MVSLQTPVHPGEILKHEFMDPLGVSAGRLAKHIGVPRTRIERLVKEKTAVTLDTAKRLGAAFGTTPEFWMNLQMNYDLIEDGAKVDVSDIEPLVAA